VLELLHCGVVKFSLKSLPNCHGRVCECLFIQISKPICVCVCDLTLAKLIYDKLGKMLLKFYNDTDGTGVYFLILYFPVA